MGKTNLKDVKALETEFAAEAEAAEGMGEMIVALGAMKPEEVTAKFNEASAGAIKEAVQNGIPRAHAEQIVRNLQGKLKASFAANRESLAS